MLPPSSSSTTSDANIDPALRELQDVMNRPPPPPNHALSHPPALPITPSLIASPTVQNSRIHARCLGTRLKLAPYQRTILEEMAEQSSTDRNITIAALVCQLKVNLDRILVCQPAWTIPPALYSNINSYALAVLLSPSLTAYKGMNLALSSRV
ncbi:hypothetical protein BDN72DRAFT_65155 [Pluteus cervinus]|uniref:Uncharacterized protein n=1 Tax=Pluteus cervinus TaxID=181527 RepID=A0ACD3APZ4_9AGAR|nr:hypothetical protein BDN72DRAFT_65155 [Pluteus cervinus]